MTIKKSLKVIALVSAVIITACKKEETKDPIKTETNVITIQSEEHAPINLRSTSNFVILAGSLISNVPTSSLTGNIGLSPAAGSFITGFGNTEITGNVYSRCNWSSRFYN